VIVVVVGILRCGVVTRRRREEIWRMLWLLVWVWLLGVLRVLGRRLVSTLGLLRSL